MDTALSIPFPPIAGRDNYLRDIEAYTKTSRLRKIPNQTYQYGSVSSKLTDVGRGDEVLVGDFVRVDPFMSNNTPQSNRVSTVHIHKPLVPPNGENKYDITCAALWFSLPQAMG
jgi:hypothetical protein